MNTLAFAWRSLVRQPARTVLGITGVAAVGALLLDMLLLSQGLIVSMRGLLERTGWDVRATSTEDLPGRGPRIRNAAAALADIAALPEVRSVIALRMAEARLDLAGDETIAASVQAFLGHASFPWTILRGREPAAAGEIVVNDTVAAALSLQPGDDIRIHPSCRDEIELLPPVRLRVAGVAEFPFEATNEYTLAGTFDTLSQACGGLDADVDLLLIASTGSPDAAASAIRAARPDLRAATNEEMLGRFQQTGFTYFRQISTVLTTVTLSFAVLLIAVLLTVSVNQRLGEIAALRALGLSRRRVVGGVLCESALLVGTGGLLSLPVGAGLAVWLDAILKRMPGIPVEMHFFVFERGAAGAHLLLLAATALLAALYPMHIVARLPIAATLREETGD